MSDAEHNLAKEVRAAQQLRQTLKAALGDDAETMADMIEGETNLHEMIGEVDKSIVEDELLIVGLEVMIEGLEKRKFRLSERIDRKRAAIEQALMIAERKTLELPCGTFTLKDVPPKLDVYDESKIPADYWKQPDPTLDRTRLGKALREIEKAPKTEGAPMVEIPGARLGNGSITLQVRRS